MPLPEPAAGTVSREAAATGNPHLNARKVCTRMSDTLGLILGLVCAGLGGELFVRGIVGLAGWARVSASIVAATFAAFATSSPELTVAVTSSLAGTPEIALGDALGSNIVNVALILGIAVLIAPIPASRDGIRRDFPAAILVPLVVGALAFDGTLSRVDGLILLGLFAIWLTMAIFEAHRQRSAAIDVLGEHRPWLALGLCLAGLAFLIASGRLIVSGALGIAASFGISPFVISATLVAFGTSMPELATALIAQIRKHSEVGLGTILGSNIFNGLFILAVAAILHPVNVEWNAVSLTLLFGVATVAITFPFRDNKVIRLQGAALLVFYLFYALTML